jgi:hypothetical protein
MDARTTNDVETKTYHTEGFPRNKVSEGRNYTNYGKEKIR